MFSPFYFPILGSTPQPCPPALGASTPASLRTSVQIDEVTKDAGVNAGKESSPPKWVGSGEMEP